MNDSYSEICSPINWNKLKLPFKSSCHLNYPVSVEQGDESSLLLVASSLDDIENSGMDSSTENKNSH